MTSRKYKFLFFLPLNFPRLINFIILFIIISSIALILSLFFGITNKLPSVIISFLVAYFLDFLYINPNKFYIHKLRLSFKDVILISFILITALFLRMNPYEFSYGGQDQGIYTNMSKYYQNNSNYFINSPYLNSTNLDLKNIFENTYNDSLHSNEEYLPGVNIHERGVWEFQFYHLHSLWMSIFGKLFGDSNSSYSLLIFSLLSILVFSVLVFIVTGSRLCSYLMGLLLAVHPLHSFFTKFAVSEIVALFFLFNALLYLTFTVKDIPRNENTYYLIVSCLSFLCLFFTRITGFLYLPFILIVTLMGILYKDKYKILNINSYLLYAVVVYSFYFLSYFYGLYTTNKYAVDIYSKFQKINIYGISSLKIYFGLNIILLLCLFLLSNFKKIKIKLKNFFLEYRIFLTKIMYVLFLTFLTLLFFKSIYIGYFETYHHHLSRWDYPQSGLKAIFASDLVSILIYSSPLIFLLLVYFIAVTKNNKIYASKIIYILPILFLMTTVVIFRFFGSSGIVPYQFYYLRYLLSEIIPIIFVLFLFTYQFIYKKLDF